MSDPDEKHKLFKAIGRARIGYSTSRYRLRFAIRRGDSSPRSSSEVPAKVVCEDLRQGLATMAGSRAFEIDFPSFRNQVLHSVAQVTSATQGETRGKGYAMKVEREELEYIVVVNHEDQYSIWPKEKTLPDGWKPEGFSGSRDGCLDHIDEVWTDMRPLSVRNTLTEKDSG